MAAVTICSDFGAPKNNICHHFHFFPTCHEVRGPDSMIFVFWMLSFKPAFSLSSFTFIKKLFVSLHFLPLKWLLLFSCPVVFDSLWPHGLQYTRPSCPLPSPGVCWSSCPLHLVMPSSHLILWHPILLPSIFPSIWVFSSESAVHIWWPKYYIFTFIISLSNKYSGLISFKTDWFDLLVLQGEHHSSKASIFLCSAFFAVELSQPYMTTRKTIALTIRTFVGNLISLLFNTLSMFVIALLPRSSLLISWLQSPSAVILEPKKRNSVTAFNFSLSIYHEVMGLDVMVFIFLIFSFKPAFSLSFFILIKRFFSSSSLSAFRVVSSTYLRLLMFLPSIINLGSSLQFIHPSFSHDVLFIEVK